MAEPSSSATGSEFRRGFRAEVEGDGASRSEPTATSPTTCSSSVPRRSKLATTASSASPRSSLDGQHRFRDSRGRCSSRATTSPRCRIEDHATITTKCTIMADVGTRAFIGANAVVSKPIPPYTVAVGARHGRSTTSGRQGEEPDGLRSFGRPRTHDRRSRPVPRSEETARPTPAGRRRPRLRHTRGPITGVVSGMNRANACSPALCRRGGRGAEENRS